MANWNATDLAMLAANAGFSGSDANVAAAIAIAESSGKPDAIGDNGTSFGLWQIHLPLHPEYANWNLLDPQVNALAARGVFQKQGFRAWTTFKTGAFQAYLRPAAPLTIDASTGQPVDPATSFSAGTAIDPSAAIYGTALSAPANSGLVNWLILGAIGIFALWAFDEATG